MAGGPRAKEVALLLPARERGKTVRLFRALSDPQGPDRARLAQGQYRDPRALRDWDIPERAGMAARAHSVHSALSGCPRPEHARGIGHGRDVTTIRYGSP